MLARIREAVRKAGAQAPREDVYKRQIFASTLTTICVFLPIVFTQGISRELFTDCLLYTSGPSGQCGTLFCLKVSMPG